jgi:hypothetical protein
MQARTLANKLTAKMATLPASPANLLTLSMAGFTSAVSQEEYRPIVVRVSNFEKGNYIWNAAQSEFCVDVITFQFSPITANAQWEHLAFGQPLAIGDSRLLRRLAPRLVQESNWDGIVRLLIHIQRQVSKRLDRAEPGRVSPVGRDSQVVSLPRLADGDENRNFLLTNTATANMDNEGPRFTFIPDTGFDGRSFAPVSVCGGSAWTFELMQSSANPESWTITCRLLRR